MLKVGFARLDVTPPLGTALTGYFYPRISDGILDPIYLNAIVFSDEKNTALLITGDFMSTEEPTTTRFRSMIEKHTGIDKNKILFQSIHQHTSTTPGNMSAVDFLYMDMLERKLLDLVDMAVTDMAEASVSYGEQDTAEPVSFIRRFWMKDGSLATNPMPMNPDIVKPAGKADNTVRVVKFIREDKNDIALVQFQTHPDVIAGNKYSADWPGFVRTNVEADLPGVSCILLNGFQGDVNHYDVKKARPATPEARYAHSKWMGRLIADAAICAYGKTAPICAEGVNGNIETIYMPTNTHGYEKIDECIQIRADFEAGKLGKTATLPIVDAFRVTNMVAKPILQTIPVSIIRFGEVCIVAFPGEPFVGYAADLRKAMPERKLLFACITNGCVGYFPTTQAYDEGGYEVTTAVLPRQIAPTLHETALKILKTL